MLVLKFGGSSMADAERILASARIVQATQTQTPVTVVVSAMAGVTDALLRVAALALADGATGGAHTADAPAVAPVTRDGATGDGIASDDATTGAGANDDAIAGWRGELARLEARHWQTYLAIGGWAPDVFALRWRALVADAEALRGGVQDATTLAGQAAMARFSGWGERLAVDLMAHALTVLGALAQAFADEPVILTGPRHGDHHTTEARSAQPTTRANALLDKLAVASPDEDDGVAQPSILATRAALAPRLAMLVTRGGVPVLPGYIARDSAERVTTLGRNGSDYSAAVIAAALGAAALYLYSDVPGLYTADPRVVPDAALLPTLTYAEAGEIAALGARALHPRTVEPTARWGIPLALRSSLTPDAPGTNILPSAAAFGAIGAFTRHEPLHGDEGQARPERWVVAARSWDGRRLGGATSDALATDQGGGDLVEVSATRLPPWPPTTADDADEGCMACVLAALQAVDADADIQPSQVWSSPRQLRLVVDAAASPHAQRLLHATLAHAAAGHTRDERVGEVMAARWANVG